MFRHFPRPHVTAVLSQDQQYLLVKRLRQWGEPTDPSVGHVSSRGADGDLAEWFGYRNDVSTSSICTCPLACTIVGYLLNNT